MTKNHIAISTTSLNMIAKAQALAKELDMAFIDYPLHESANKYAYLLLLTPEFIGLQKTGGKKIIPFYIDFLAGKVFYRSKLAGRRNELLARAIGLNPRENPKIIDATAGLGRDSFILAKLGYEVTMLERSPILYLLLQDGLDRAQHSDELASTIKRLHLIHADAISWLKHVEADQRPDIIYLDPMFPSRQKSASVKKEMAIVQNVLGSDMDSNELFSAALSCATRRVVVKRPRLAPNIAERDPNFSIEGRSSRFDVYLILSK